MGISLAISKHANHMHLHETTRTYSRMPFKKFKKQYLSINDLNQSDNLLRVINTLQGNIEDSLTPIVAKIQNDSLVLTSISLSAGQNNIVNHTLGRPITGYKVVRYRAQADIWDDQDNNPSPNLTLWLHSSADVVIDLEVF